MAGSREIVVVVSELLGTNFWKVARRRLPQNQHQKNYGYTDYENRTIVVHHRLQGVDLFRTLIHEAVHAACRDLNEDAVCRIEDSVTNACWPLLDEIHAAIKDESDDC